MREKGKRQPAGKSALFVHDFRLLFDENEVRARHFPYSLWKDRYLQTFDRIEVVGRAVRPGEKPDGLPISSGPGLSFTIAPNLSHPVRQFTSRGEVAELLSKKIAQVDLTIARVPSELGLLAAEQARKAGAPYLLEVVGCPFDSLWNHGSLQGKLWAHISAKRMRKAVRLAPHVIYVTSEFLQKRYPTDGRSIACSNVTLTSVVSAPRQKSDAKVTRLGLIGFLGTDNKGVDTAIRALASLGNPALTLEVVGGGDFTRLKDLANTLGVASRVVFMGQLGHEEVIDWLDTVDVYLQPSRNEGLPRALLEAMSRGLPALGSTAGGIPELLAPSDLHPPSDHRQLKVLLERATSDKRWLAAASERNLATAKKYLFSTLNQRRQDFFAEALSSNASSVQRLVAKGR